MKLTYSERNTEKKREAGRLRKNGNLPAVLYSAGNETQSISIETAAFQTALREMRKGRLATTVFSLVDAKGKEHKAIVKDIQYHPTTYDILHLDFEELHDDVQVSVKVPIEFTGEMECAGVKLGGVIRQVIRFLRVRCLPKDMPRFLTLDVRDMALSQTKRLADLTVPEGVSPVADLNEVAVVIAKR